jgi:uncharacterized protein YkwD
MGSIMKRILLSFLTLNLLVLAPPSSSAAGDTEERLLAALQEERRQFGVGLLVRRDDLDTVALARAKRVAGLPHAERLALDESIQAGLREAGIRLFRNAAVHLDMVRGYSDPAAGFLKSWRGYTMAWEKVRHPMHDSIGLATYTAADGWVILVAVLLDELPVYENLREFEGKTIAAVNEVRSARGLPVLVELPALTAIARDHSEEMAREGYFSHESPAGMEARDRILAAGLEFRALAENIHQSRGSDDPVDQAVRSWMESAAHRKAILDPRYLKTGVGVATDADGMVFFTQLFYEPPESE